VNAPLFFTIGLRVRRDWWPLRVAQLRAFLVAAARATMLACVLVTLGVAGAVSASAAGVGYTYDASTSVYDAATGILPSHSSEGAPGTSQGVFNGLQGSHATVAGLFASLSKSVAADSGALVRNPEPQFLPNGVPNRGPAAWVNAVDGNGAVTTHASSPGIHAEVAAQTAVLGASMSEVWGWRGPTSAPTWQRTPICLACQAQIPPSLFPPAVLADPCPWGAK